MNILLLLSIAWIFFAAAAMFAHRTEVAIFLVLLAIWQVIFAVAIRNDL